MDLISEQHRYAWHVRPEFSTLLLGPDGLRLDDWLRDGAARVIKSGPQRAVFHVVLPGLSFYVKRYPLADLRSWARQLVRPSKARGEYFQALEVARRGVPTFFPLGFGEVPSLLRPGESFLITQALEDTEALNAFLEETWPTLTPERQLRLAPRLTEALAHLLARMHDAGVCHNDLHAGNILVRLNPDDRPELFLIDLYAVTLRGPLDWRTSRGNLVVINRWFSLRVSRSARLRFWLAYCAARRCCDGLIAPRSALRAQRLALARDLERRTRDSNISFWLRREQRCLKNNRRFRRLRTATVAGHVVTDLEPDLVERLLDDPDEPFRRPGVRCHKDSRSSTVVEIDVLENGTLRRAIYKRFRLTAWSDPWVALVRPTAALRSWKSGHGFRERSLPTPRPLLVLHRRRAGLPCEGYLLTEKIETALDLLQFVAHLDSLPARPRRRLLRHAIDRVAAVIRHMHRCRLSHRDLKAANILVRSQADSLLVWLIDLVGVARYRRLRRPRRVQNLARLHASFCNSPSLTRTDKLRFLRTYMQWGLFGREGWKNWWQAIDRATRAKVARNRRRGRRLW